MQVGAGNAGTRQKNGVKHRGGSQHAGAANSDFDITDGAFLDFRRILEGNSPARELVGAAKGLTRSKIVDLDNSAVHIKIKGAAGFANALDLGNGILNIGIYVIARGYREAEDLI